MAPSLLTVWERLAELPVEVERIELERLERQVSSGFTRVTTLIHLHGRGEEGVGEDVTYVAELHDGAPAAGARRARAARRALRADRRRPTSSRCAPEHDVYRSYRRWGWESARARPRAAPGTASSLRGGARARAAAGDVRRCRAGSATRRRPTIARGWLELYPTLRFKLDPTPSWDDGLVAELAETGAVDDARPEGRLPRHGRRQPARPGALRARRRGLPGRVDRGSRPDPGDGRRARALPRPRDLGRA